MRESYVKVEVTQGLGDHMPKMSCYPGVEFKDTDTDEDLLRIAKHLRWATGIVLWGYAPSHQRVCKALEKWIKKVYPGRAYFIETELEGVGVQVYDPRDFVKTRCECKESDVQ